MQRFSCHVDLDFDDLIVRDHRVHGVRVLPGVVFFDLASRALVARGLTLGSFEFAEVLFQEPVVVTEDAPRRIELSFTSADEGRSWSVRGASRSHGVATARENFRATVRVGPAAAPTSAPNSAAPVTERLDLDAAYAYARAVGIEHLSFMKGQGEIELCSARLLARIEPSALAMDYAEEFLLHPACLDSATLVPFLAVMRGQEEALRPFIPIHLRRFRAWRSVCAATQVVVERGACQLHEDLFVCDIELRDPASGALLACFEGLSTKRIRSPKLLQRLLMGAGEEPAPRAPSPAPTCAASGDPNAEATALERASALVQELVASELDDASAELDEPRSFYELGLDSADLLSVSARLGERLGVSIYPTLLFEHSSIAALAEHLAGAWPESFTGPTGEPQQAEAAPLPSPSSAASPWVADRETEAPAVDEPIAVVGLAGRYAQAPDVETLWREILAPGADCIEEIPASRWDHERWFDPDRKRSDRCYARWGSFITGIDQFDPVAFQISPREAELMDPQARHFLEVASEALTDAGYATRAFAGRRVGVFAGVMWTQYEALGIEHSVRSDEVLTPMAFAASVANRVSHHFDLRGPSLAVDSMCSSSLTALHLACESLRHGECEAALVGGVNLILHPSKYLFLARNQMLASDGRCRSFGQGGDGYVPGEGVGVVLLKPLAAAERDGDEILGLIRATALNHGGHANGYTVPDPDAQAAVIREALERAGLEPAALSYVEAHGTGTSLGDPIEVRGLDKALARPGQAPSCAIGSIKSNLGHLEAAAGVAGLTKVLLQLRHGQLAPSLHARALNPHIDFESSTLRVQRELGEWRPAADGRRRAGLSSFGAGGSNAHAIIEEYRPKASELAPQRPELIVLSARTQAQLEGGAARLRGRLEAQSTPSLARVAYTLLARDGGEAERAATVVEDLADLRRALAQLDGARWQRGRVSRRQAGRHERAEDRGVEALTRLAQAYIEGAVLELDSLWPTRPRRCSLPSWPFAHRRCWLPDGRLGPLVHRRIEDGAQDRARFATPTEAFAELLADHRVDGRGVVPGVATAMMLRAAAAHAGHPDASLRSLRWLDFVDASAAELDIQLAGQAIELTRDGAVLASAELGSVAPPSRLQLAAIRGRCAERWTASDCYLALADRGLEYGPRLQVIAGVAVGQREALAELDCDERGLHWRAIAALDGALQAIVTLLEAGPGQRWLPGAVDELAVHGETPARGLAHLRVREQSASRCRFDIELCDEAGLVWATLEGVEAQLALGVGPRWSDSIRALTERWVPEPPTATTETSSGPLLVFDDAAGRLAEALARGWSGPLVSVREGTGFARDGAGFRVRPGSRADLDALLAALDAASLRPVAVVHGWSLARARPLTEALELGFHTLLALTGAWLARRPGPLRLLHLHRGGAPVDAAVEGLCRTAGSEHHGLSFSTLALEPEGPQLGARVLTELAASHDAAPLRWTAAGRERLRRFALELELDEPGLAFATQRPVVLLTGGLGGLGVLVARELVRRDRERARVILVGRRAPKAVASRLDELRRELGELSYEQADVSQAAEVDALIAQVLAEHGRLDAVIHSAGVLQDGLLSNLDRGAAEAVLAPKLLGAHHLDRATRGLPLEAFVLFSSAAGMIGNPGQAAYAYANRYLDRLAEDRAAAVVAGRARGRSLSIAWPLWREGGMRVDAAAEAMLERRLGMRPLASRDGLRCLRWALGLDAPVVAFMAGELARIDAVLECRGPAPLGDPREARLRACLAELLEVEPEAIDLSEHAQGLGLDPNALTQLCTMLEGELSEPLSPLRIGELTRLAELVRFFDHPAEASPRSPAAEVERPALDEIRTIIAELLGLELEEVDPEAPLREFGVDSITLVELAERLGEHFGVELAPAALFELERVTEILDQLRELGGLEDSIRPALGPVPAPEPRTPAQVEAPGPRDHGERERDVAIVGLSARFPGSPDLEQLWRNLVERRDLIVEVPSSRWDWRAIDGDALDGPNQTRARWGGFIDGVDRFDAEFFAIAPKDAEWMDPQHRLMLEETWAALADAGYRPEELRGTETGVFIGIGSTDYHDRARALALAAQAQSALGKAHSVLPNRISYLLDLHGPSLPVETACSSSLVAVDHAITAIRSGRCELAIVGGVNLILDPYLSVCFDRAGMLSPRGRCRSFDAGADGYVRGEGLGVVVLESPRRARARGVRIRALIKGSAVNHGGLANALTAPNPKAQARLIVAAHRDASVDPASVGYVEAHGTGTPLGDPIEVRGLSKALAELHAAWGRARPPAGHCAIGTIKSNLGHLETAAGIAGLIKTVLCLERETIPGLAHFETLNSQIDLADAPLRVAAKTEAWPAPVDGQPRRAGVSSFGFGGTNAHVVLEQAPSDQRPTQAPLPRPRFRTTRYWLPAAKAEPTSRSEQPLRPRAARARTRPGSSRAQVLAELEQLLIEVAKIPPERIDPRVDFERYGLESVLILELNHALRRRFGALPATLFYKYKTLDSLADYLADRVGSSGEPERPAHEPETTPADIAIIGASGRYPGAADLDELWTLLAEGRHAITEIPATRWDVAAFYDEQPQPGRIYCKWGGFLDEVERFDAAHFEIAPWLARYMDPQERLFLEQAWACVEDAGYDPRALGPAADATGERRAPVGVFVGASYNEYASLAAEANAREGARAPYNTQTFSIANRVSYALGLGGPSMTVDTACSASLSAVHLACEALRNGACELAIAGGVNLSLHPNKYLMLCANRFAAADGRCRSFAEGGQGYVPGEGVGAVLLKPLAAALRDGDAIHALIKGSAVNHDGKTFGYTVPNPVAQTAVITAAWDRAGIEARTLSYIEAHGTGTSLGDPLEIAGLNDAFARGEAPKRCAIGSLKANLGHLEAAAGIAGLHKVMLQMRHQSVAPTPLHGPRLNPEIDFEPGPCRVQLSLEPWVAAGGTPLRAGLSSFGAGGVNVHVVLESWTAPKRAREDRLGAQLVPLSARTPAQLREQAQRLLAWVEAELDEDPRVLADLAFTLQTGRTPLGARLAIVTEDQTALAEDLRRFLADEAAPTIFVGEHSPNESAPGSASRLHALALDELAAAWVDGRDWPWRELYPEDSPRRRLHLPSYPFAGERHWIEVASAPLPARQASTPIAGTTPVEEALDALRLTPSKTRGPACERLVSAIVIELLGFPAGQRPDPQLGLFAMGMESVQSTALVVRLEQLLDLTLHATLVFDYPSIRELATYLTPLLPSELPCDQTKDPATASNHAPARAQRRMTSVAAQPAEPLELVLAHGRWQPQPLAHDHSVPSQRLTLTAGPALAAELDARDHATLAELLAAELGGDLSEPLFVVDFGLLRPLSRAPHAAFFRLFELARALFETKREVELLIVHGLASPAARTIGEALAGFARSLRLEVPRLRCRILGVDDDMPPAALAALLLAEAGAGSNDDTELRYEAGVRQRRVLIERASPPTLGAALEPGAVTLISGGLGKLGLLVAERLGRSGARLALLSRSSPRPDQAEALARLRSAGVELISVVADVGDLSALESALAEVRARFGRLDAVIHAAGCLRDSLLVHKTEAEAELVLTAKLDGCRNLDRATADDALELFALFASTAGLTGNVGQCDYAFANAYLDGFVRERSLAVAAGRRCGRSLVFDWPLWAEGGMQVDASVLAFMAQRAGFHPMPSQAGLDLLEWALAGGEGQFSVFHGEGERIRRQWLTMVDEPAPRAPGSERAVDDEEAIAIVSLACRFPGANSPEDLWQLLLDGRVAVGEIPDSRWNVDAYHDPDREAEGRHYTRCGAFLDQDPGLFDAGLFGISPREAAQMDPQQRLLLELSWEALEAAGIAPDRLAQTHAGVFVGMTGSEYAQLPRRAEQYGAYTATGIATNVAAGRIAHLLGTRGPAMTVDTACSSSLMAVHLARQSLRLRETDLAIVGGVNLLLAPETFVALSQMGALAPDGRCKPFAAAADGYGRGEGCAVVILERLADARRLGHPVAAILHGSAANHDGKSAGLTVPSGRAQQLLLERALANAGLEPEQVGYIEAHGTGTPLGDPIELRALAQVYGRRDGPPVVGAIKANLSHLEAAAGIAGLIKATLCLQEEEIPAQPRFDVLNPRIDLGPTKLAIARQRRPWTGPRRVAGVSAFGFSGTNVHVLVGAAPVAPTHPGRRLAPVALLCLSAASSSALRTLAGRWRELLLELDDETRARACAASWVARAQLRHRAAVIGGREELLAGLERLERGDEGPGLWRSPTAGALGFDGLAPDPARLEAARGDRPRFTELCAGLAKAFVAGASLEPEHAACFADPRSAPALPRYPFERRRYWIEAPARAAGPLGLSARSKSLTLSHALLPDLADNHGVLHIGHYLDLVATEAARELGIEAADFERIEFRQALRLSGGERRELELRFEPRAEGFDWSLRSRANDSVHACGHLVTASARWVASEIPARGEAWSRQRFYDRLEALSFDLGPSVRWVETLEDLDGAVAAAFGPDPGLPEDVDTDLDLEPGLGFHPGILDACAQLVAVAAAAQLEPGMRFMVVAMRGVRRRPLDEASRGRRVGRCHLRMLGRAEPAASLRATLTLFDDRGQILIEIDELELRRLDARDIARLERGSRARTQTQPGLERRAHVRACIAAQLDMDPEELNPQVPLHSYGLDSIIGLALARDLGELLGVEVGVERLLAGPSIDELLAELSSDEAHAQPPIARASEGPWFEFVARRPSPELQLFCLPYGAGGASAYRRWAETLDPRVEVWPVQLPGRETRLGERPHADLDGLLDALEPALLAALDRPFALYGQSMGGLVALELARRLEARGHGPRHLIVGGISAPSVTPNPYLARLRARLAARGLPQLPPPGSAVVPDAFWEVFRELPEAASRDHAFLQPVVPMVLADLALITAYRHRPEPRLRCPITVVHGTEDDRVPADSLAGWTALSHAPVRRVDLRGDHFFITDQDALPTLARELQRSLFDDSQPLRRGA